VGRRLACSALVAVAAAAGPLVLGGGSADAQPGLSLRVDRDPFRVALLSEGGTVVQEAPFPARLRYQLRSTGDIYSVTGVLSQEGNVYTLETNERGGGRTATVTLSSIRGGYRIAVSIEPATDVQQVYDSFVAQPGEHFLGGGERTGAVDLRSQVLPIYVSPTCSYAPVPFFAASSGWGLWLESENVAGLAFPDSAGGSGCGLDARPSCEFPQLGDRVDVCTQGASLVEDVYVGSEKQVLADYQAQTGPPLVPPAAEFAAIQWRGRTEFTLEQNLFDDVRRFRAAGIPLGWVLIDDVWQTCMGTLTFNGARFPDPAALVQSLHALGVRVMLWVSPKSVCGTYPDSELLGPPGDTVLDLRNPAVSAAFRQQLQRLVMLGVDGMKADRGDEVDLTPIDQALQNEYPLLYAQDVMDVLPPGSAAIFRAASVGSQRLVPGIWAGDQTGDFTGLEHAIRSGETAAVSGFPMWGSDIGGYNAQNLTPDVFARWAELGAVSPIFEVGGAGPNSTPWELGANAMTALRDAAVLHYELFPYFYRLVAHGLPVLRPLAYAYPDDPGSWSHDLEFLVGPSLLAAPVTAPGTSTSVYLPPGSWIDLHTGALVSGGSTFTRPTPLTQLPLYLRADSVVPFNLRTRTPWWRTSELAHRGHAGFLAANGARLHLRHEPRGVQVFIPAPRRPRVVTFAGRPVAWSWNPGPLRGVVIRLRGPTVVGVVDVN
jgi:alpha-glucosidase (family GH31 glycosyl hydrolase)